MKYKRNFEVVFQLIDGQAYLLKQNLTFKLNDIGIEYWLLLDGDHTVSDIVKKVTDRYSLPKEKIEVDVQLFIDSMGEYGLASLLENTNALLPSYSPQIKSPHTGLLTE